MFSWSNQRNSASSSSQYPGRRLQNRDVSPVVEGSIRQSTTTSGYTRAQHLSSYLDDATLKRSTRRVGSGDTTYDTVFQTTAGDTLILRVNIPLESSFSPFFPAMTLAGVRVRHPWVEPVRMRVTGYDPIATEQTWDQAGICLGTAVHAVVKHLQLNPPQILEITDPGLQSIQPNPNKQYGQSKGRHDNHKATSNQKHRTSSSTSSSSDAPPSYDVFARSSTTPAPDVPLPTIPMTFPAVDDMDRDDLEARLQNEDIFMDMVRSTPVYDQIETLRTSKVSENLALAEKNLGKEEQLTQLHKDVSKMKDELKQKLSTFQEMETKQTSLCAPPDSKQILKRLNRAKKEAFDESEELAEEWVEDGADNVNDFVKRFIESRKVHHLRGAKMEILVNNSQQLV